MNELFFIQRIRQNRNGRTNVYLAVKSQPTATRIIFNVNDNVVRCALGTDYDYFLNKKDTTHEWFFRLSEPDYKDFLRNSQQN
jgi:hypothetical protein